MSFRVEIEIEKYFVMSSTFCTLYLVMPYHIILTDIAQSLFHKKYDK